VEQTDLFHLKDQIQEYKRSLRASVARTPIKNVAARAGVDPTTLRHQLDEWNRRKQPSAVLAVVQLWHDPQHADEVLGQVGKRIVLPPKLSPEDALRRAVDQSKKGFLTTQELAELLAQTDLGGAK
jgi:hypothetical protein